MRRAVHLRGRGAVTGFGRGAMVLIDGVMAGRSAVRARRRTADFPAPTAVVAEFPAAAIADGAHGDMALAAACAAGAEALADAGLRAADTGLVFASTKGDIAGVVGSGDGHGCPHRLASRIAASLGLPTVHATVSCACASGLVALATAARRIAAGEIEHALVLGADVVCHFVLSGFGGVHALDPEPCRPFDAARRGVSLGDGAGALVLSATPGRQDAARLAGHAGANDACHVTGPDYQGLGLGTAARRAIAHAGLTTADVDVIHLHGTGTRANDGTEAIGLGNLFDGRTPPAFGTKGHTGHTLGAAGILEVLLLDEALRRGIAPPNHGLVATDVDARLDLVTATPRTLARAHTGLKVASGFGGVQAAVVVQR